MSWAKYLIFIAFFLAFSANAQAATVNRHILAVIDGNEVTNEFNNSIYLRAETPLNHLGYILDYVDVTKKLPDDTEMAKYGAVISWFSDNRLKGSAEYVKWLTHQLDNGKKLVILNDFGFLNDDKGKPTPPELIETFYKTFGVTLAANTETTSTPLLLEILVKDPAIMDFERKVLPSDLNYFEKLNVTDKNSRVYLKLRRKDTGSTYEPVFTNSKGGAAFYQYSAYSNPFSYQTRWVINPFEFFARALNANFPKPDVTTLNGSRIFFSQVDDDDINEVSFTDLKTTCGELFYKNILTKYPMPTTFGITVGRILSEEGRKRENILKLIDKILALPNVEPASHGMAAPKTWRGKKSRFAFDVDDYEYSPANEIGASIAYINDHLTKPDKKTRLFFWTGDNRPDSDALRYVKDNGLLDINGGTTRFDSLNNSYTFVTPLFFHNGDLIQNLNAIGSEDLFTNSGTGPLYGYRYVIETLKRTESPVRIRPIDVHTSVDAMKQQLSINTLEEVYDWLTKQELAPIFTSAYLEIVGGFLTTQIDAIAPGQWSVSNIGALKTLRFDNEDRNVDLTLSTNVLGFERYQKSLYVHLGSEKTAAITLTENAAGRFYLVSANGTIKDWKADSGNVDFALTSIGKHKFKLGGLNPGGHYNVSLGSKNIETIADKNGTITVSEMMAHNGFETTHIHVQNK